MFSTFIFYEDKENWTYPNEMTLAKINETERVRENENCLFRCWYFNTGIRNINLQQKTQVTRAKVNVVYC
jgi:hypothetical protein